MTPARRLAFDLPAQLSLAGLPAPVPEYRFAPPRRWRFDWAYPDRRIALEREGGIWVRGRHTRGRGYEADCRKYNRAAVLGWVVLRFSPGMIRSGEALALVLEAWGT